jgi:hypothetical protein
VRGNPARFRGFRGVVGPRLPEKTKTLPQLENYGVRFFFMSSRLMPQ